MRQCPLLEKCKKASGIDCADRDFDGRQEGGNARWAGKEPCNFYYNLEKDEILKPKRERIARKGRHDILVSPYISPYYY